MKRKAIYAAVTCLLMTAAPAFAQLNLGGGGNVGGGANLGGAEVPGSGAVQGIAGGAKGVVEGVRGAASSAADAARGAARVGANVGLQLNESARAALPSNGLGLRLDNRSGLRVSQVADGSLAARSGMRVGDQILAVNRNWVRSTGDLSARLSAAFINNAKVPIYVNRSGERTWVWLNADSRAPLGVSMQTENDAVRLTNVVDGSAAAAAGLKVGDQVVAVNGQKIKSNADLSGAVEAAADENGSLEMIVLRNDQRVNLTANLDTANAAAATDAAVDADVTSGDADAAVGVDVDGSADTEAKADAKVQTNAASGGNGGVSAAGNITGDASQ